MLCTPGFTGVQTPYLVDPYHDQDELLQASQLSHLDNQTSILPVCVQSTVCVLRGGAGKSEKAEFVDCLLNSGCGEWGIYSDKNNGNTAALCLE
ncbi:MAG: hypothetical protein OXF06_07805 [Bacteroidetes bacterium]|nr:hypothetical protein [Bacteroidota bacterium]MCY4224727.1 hypothetical protein [Bacteroidota bacterium]